MRRRIGAYVLPGDPTWLEKTLAQYYPLLDALVIPVPDEPVGWTGVRIDTTAALSAIDRVDVHGLARFISGHWVDRRQPMHMETAQRQAALDALIGEVDWVIQLDNDEYLPEPAALLAAIDEAENRGLNAIEWPMRVLYRRTRRYMFEIVGNLGEPIYDWPGPVAVRPTLTLVNARRAGVPFLRVAVVNDKSSLPIRRPPADGERRWDAITHRQAIIHNSWARSPRQIWQKTRSWGHADGWRGIVYYALTWWPILITWRTARDVHPFARGLWPRVNRRAIEPEER